MAGQRHIHCTIACELHARGYGGDVGQRIPTYGVHQLNEAVSGDCFSRCGVCGLGETNSDGIMTLECSLRIRAEYTSTFCDVTSLVRRLGQNVIECTYCRDPSQRGSRLGDSNHSLESYVFVE